MTAVLAQGGRGHGGSLLTRHPPFIRNPSSVPTVHTPSDLVACAFSLEVNGVEGILPNSFDQTLPSHLR